MKNIKLMDHSSHPYGFFESEQFKERSGLISNYLIVTASKNFEKDLQYSHVHLKNESLPFAPNQKLSGNLIRVTSVSSHFHVLAPHGRCCQPSTTNSFTDTPCKERTSDTAKLNDCIVATNAGFFDVANGYCLGKVISNGKVLNDYGRVHPNAAFGLIDDGKGNAQYVFGYLNQTDYEKLKITQLVQVGNSSMLTSNLFYNL
ncbi:predicted protein [Naegleria gruberi]|uniref:Predicted protein n=1 Tax=Naegleria gruberi TaxID=5762 RepID=D2W0I7_NAEGR|nr:uncharacterized protein NAEGRDRAFT_74873 [Naegleria gruberi]EFC37435.1 predicted protein [Naegleria gruberi]|eukprot:XP_002670179.1 predicted protein [Naegleria gruberi strain NEG-M]